MDPTITSHETVEKIKQEHDALREKFRQIHDVLSGPEIVAEQIATLLRELQNALQVHFSNEELGGFFDEVTARAPRLTVRADQLCTEHEQLLHRATELCEFAETDGPSLAWWRELSSRCHEFSKQMMHHESEENKLLQQAYQDDIGTFD
jgi:iron-sulfur cluster repair protein YtfE (RIC family)